jgi:hypothetical protein
LLLSFGLAFAAGWWGGLGANLYRVGVRQFLARKPDRGWDWIGSMPTAPLI